MHAHHTVRVIAHIHTRHSNGRASEMDPLIGAVLRRLYGAHAHDDLWSECLTPVQRLVQLLQRPNPRRAVGIVLVTDHMNARSHRLPDELLSAAAQEPRLATGGELFCVERDVDGTFRAAPEVLIYGAAEPVEGPFGPHFGLSQEILDEIYRTCRAPGSEELQTSLVLRYCAEHRLACALAHPFDGHELSASRMLEVLSQADYVETVNGGFPAESTRFLDSAVDLVNRVARGESLPEGAAERWPRVAELVDVLREQRRGFVHPWGGSDAHSHDFDRVVVRFASRKPRPTAGDVLGAMLERPVEEHLALGTFQIEGRPGSSASVLDDIVRVVARNFQRLAGFFARNPRFILPTLYEAQRVVRAIVSGRATRQADLLREVERDFPLERVLEELDRARPRREADGDGHAPTPGSAGEPRAERPGLLLGAP